MIYRTMSLGDELLYLAWCWEQRLDPEDTATMVAYEEDWLYHHGEPE